MESPVVLNDKIEQNKIASLADLRRTMDIHIGIFFFLRKIGNEAEE